MPGIPNPVRSIIIVLDIPAISFPATIPSPQVIRENGRPVRRVSRVVEIIGRRMD
jgi:hypothetical protein